MTVIPAINETDFLEIRKKIEIAKKFGANWVHLDVSDGKFTKNKLWNNPQDLKIFQIPNSKFQIPKIEVHLMIENPELALDDWLDAGVKRIFIHLEAIKIGTPVRGRPPLGGRSHSPEARATSNGMKIMLEKCELFGADLGLAVNPETSAADLAEYTALNHFLILAVNPGLAGQKFQESQLEKIKLLRSLIGNGKIIEVDGGVNLDNALKLKEAGADILISASYIWDSKSPKENFNKLKTI